MDSIPGPGSGCPIEDVVLVKNERISPDEIAGSEIEPDAGFGVRDVFGGEAGAVSA